MVKEYNVGNAYDIINSFLTGEEKESFFIAKYGELSDDGIVINKIEMRNPGLNPENRKTLKKTMCESFVEYLNEQKAVAIGDDRDELRKYLNAKNNDNNNEVVYPGGLTGKEIDELLFVYKD